MFANKVAFITVLNFPHYTLEEKNAMGPGWDRLQWAYARMGDLFTERVPATVSQTVTAVRSAAEAYVDVYNIQMGHLLTEEGRRIFPEDMSLLSHWNLRDELKSNYADVFRHMVAKGIDELSSQSGDKGFVMMIEGSSIDDWLHENRIDLAMEELLDFDRTLGDVLKWAEADGHTLVVVTADHATGALTLQDGDLAEGRIGVAFGNDSHNGIAVPYYVWGPGSDRFHGTMENSELGALIMSCVR